MNIPDNMMLILTINFSEKCFKFLILEYQRKLP